MYIYMGSLPLLWMHPHTQGGLPRPKRSGGTPSMASWGYPQAMGEYIELHTEIDRNTPPQLYQHKHTYIHIYIYISIILPSAQSPSEQSI